MEILERVKEINGELTELHVQVKALALELQFLYDKYKLGYRTMEQVKGEHTDDNVVSILKGKRNDK